MTSPVALQAGHLVRLAGEWGRWQIPASPLDLQTALFPLFTGEHPWERAQLQGGHDPESSIFLAIQPAQNALQRCRKRRLCLLCKGAPQSSHSRCPSFLTSTGYSQWTLAFRTTVQTSEVPTSSLPSLSCYFYATLTTLIKIGSKLLKQDPVNSCGRIIGKGEQQRAINLH